MFVVEPKRETPILMKADLCVIGGGCTGTFAAVRAARMGLSVVIAEKSNCFGGVAANSLSSVWHSLHDVDFKEQIIGGLTFETITELTKRGAVNRGNESVSAYEINNEQLKIVLDEMICEQKKITPMLHTTYCGLQTENGRVTTVFVQNKEGRFAVLADFFIDATGDGDLCRDLKMKRYTFPNIQPPTPCYKVFGNFDGVNVADILQQHHDEVGLPNDWGWSFALPGADLICTRADTHVFNVNCAVASDLTYAEMEGRRQIDRVLTLLNRYGNGKYILTDICSNIGIRDTFHYETDYRLTENDLLSGEHFEDAVANGTYRIDVHDDDHGISFKYLDGTTEVWEDRTSVTYGRWREPTENNPKYYQIPFKTLVQRKYSNFIAVGRMINAEQSAFGAVRVMVNLNQLGEAAGVAGAICVDSNVDICDVDSKTLRNKLKDGGSIIL